LSIEMPIDFSIIQIAYQSFIGVNDLEKPIDFPKLQLTYQSSTDIKTDIIQYPGEELYLKTSYNAISFIFSHKAWLFDGSIFEEFSSPIVAIYPFATVQENKIFVGGGFRKDLSIVENVYVYGAESYLFVADDDYLAVIIPSGITYIVDDKGNIIQTTTQPIVTPLLRNWRVISRNSFTVIVQRLR
jgi:hypothetical protein